MPALIELLVESLADALRANDAARAAYVRRVIAETVEIKARALAARPKPLGGA